MKFFNNNVDIGMIVLLTQGRCFFLCVVCPSFPYPTHYNLAPKFHLRNVQKNMYIHSPATITNMLFPVWKSCAVIPTIKLQNNTLCCREKKHLIVTTTIFLYEEGGGRRICGGTMKCIYNIWMKFSVVEKKKGISTMIYLKFIKCILAPFWLQNILSPFIISWCYILHNFFQFYLLSKNIFYCS